MHQIYFRPIPKESARRKPGKWHIAKPGNPSQPLCGAHIVNEVEQTTEPPGKARLCGSCVRRQVINRRGLRGLVDLRL